MALLLGSESFAVAAKYNIIVVALAMPAVIGTGLIDWKNRYGGRMSRVFLVKMICAGIVTFLSFILAIWWIVHPTLHAGGFAANSLFLLLNLANLAAAAVAGWYGGKLVFNK
jgi:small neutral amino acid transporter SnatA (MarC family)